MSISEQKLKTSFRTFLKEETSSYIGIIADGMEGGFVHNVSGVVNTTPDEFVVIHDGGYGSVWFYSVQKSAHYHTKENPCYYRGKYIRKLTDQEKNQLRKAGKESRWAL